MTFEITPTLETRLRKTGNYERLERDYNTICSREGDPKKNKKYAHALIDLLEMTVRFEQRKTPYCILGGLAVLGHEMQANPDAAVEWRGTDDVDLLAKIRDIQPVMDELNYQKPQADNRRRDGVIGAVYNYTKMNTPTDRLVVVGVREGVELNAKDFTQHIYANSRVVDMYGVKVRISGIPDLISMKQYAARCGRSKSKDRNDIKTLKRLKKKQKALA